MEKNEIKRGVGQEFTARASVRSLVYFNEYRTRFTPYLQKPCKWNGKTMVVVEAFGDYRMTRPKSNMDKEIPILVVYNWRDLKELIK